MKMHNPDRPHYRRPSRHRLLMACDDLDLSLALLKWCRQHDESLYAARPRGTDLIAVPCFAMVVDTGYVGEKGWDAYCDFCSQVAAEVPKPEKCESEMTTCESLHEREQTPVIIVDEPAPGEAPERPRIPPSKEDLIFSIPRSRVMRILRTLDELLFRR